MTYTRFCRVVLILTELWKFLQQYRGVTFAAASRIGPCYFQATSCTVKSFECAEKIEGLVVKCE